MHMHTYIILPYVCPFYVRMKLTSDAPAICIRIRISIRIRIRTQ